MNKVSLNISNITVQYANNVILNNISHDFHESTANVIVGNNGTGKSTLLRTIIGMNAPTSGSISLYDKNIIDLAIHERVRKGISYLRQDNNFFDHLKVFEHIDLVIGRNISEKKDLLNNYLPEILNLSNKYAGNLSGGEQRLLGFSLLFLQKNKKIVMLDEVFAGVSPDFKSKISYIIENVFLKDKMTVILVEQNEDLIESFKGKVIDINSLKN